MSTFPDSLRLLPLTRPLEVNEPGKVLKVPGRRRLSQPPSWRPRSRSGRGWGGIAMSTFPDSLRLLPLTRRLGVNEPGKVLKVSGRRAADPDAVVRGSGRRQPPFAAVACS